MRTVAAALVAVVALLALLVHRVDRLESVEMPEPVMDNQWIREHEEPGGAVVQSLERIYNESLEDWKDRWEALP